MATNVFIFLSSIDDGPHSVENFFSTKDTNGNGGDSQGRGKSSTSIRFRATTLLPFLAITFIFFDQRHLSALDILGYKRCRPVIT